MTAIPAPRFVLPELNVKKAIQISIVATVAFIGGLAALSFASNVTMNSTTPAMTPAASTPAGHTCSIGCSCTACKP